MAKLLMRTSGAEPTEVDGMINLLEEHDIACYMTDSGRWLIGVDGLWVADDMRLEEARALMATFQEAFSAAAKEQHQLDGTPNFLTKLWAQPMAVIVTVAALLIVLLVSVVPFIWF